MKGKDQKYSEGYYDDNGQNGDRPALRMFCRMARRHIPAGRVLDFGCGPGFFLQHLARHYDASGVEVSDWANSAAQERTGLPVFRTIDEVADRSQDGIVSVHVVEHIPDPDLAEVLAGWRRVLKPGGKALVITPDASGFAAKCKGDKWIAFTDPTHINLKSHEQWERLFRDAGFRVVRHVADGLWDFPYIFIWMGRFEALILGWPTLLQFVLGRPLLPIGSGESGIMLLELSEPG